MKRVRVWFSFLWIAAFLIVCMPASSQMVVKLDAIQSHFSYSLDTYDGKTVKPFPEIVFDEAFTIDVNWVGATSIALSDFKFIGLQEYEPGAWRWEILHDDPVVLSEADAAGKQTGDTMSIVISSAGGGTSKFSKDHVNSVEGSFRIQKPNTWGNTPEMAYLIVMTATFVNGQGQAVTFPDPWVPKPPQG